jgi:hemerythrin superfamily protein
MNAIFLLQKDHRAVEGIFDQLHRLKGNGSSRKKQELCEKLVRELSIHAAIEEMIFYPEVKKAIAEAKEIVIESLEEHNVIKWELDAIQSSKVSDAHFDAKIKVLKDAFMRHIEEEENVLFPMVRQGMATSELGEIGKRLEHARSIAPTRPHPRAPNRPPANVVIGVGASIVDRAMDAVRTTVRGRSSKPAATRKAKAVHRTPKKRAPAHAKRTRAQRAHAH